MKACLIIGNGPSLKDIPLDFLYSYTTFGSNRIYLLDCFTPDYYACVNPLVVTQYAEEIAAMQCKGKFIASSCAHLIPGAHPLYSIGARIFSDDPLRMIYEGYTVTYVLMQLAYWLGFERVGLVGVDHSYQFTGMPNQECIASGDDPNHFHPGYFSDGVKWNNPDLLESEFSYRMARAKFEKAGREIVNLTPGSKLDVFDREDWQSWQK